MSALLVTGTDTGVGKTLVSATIAAGLAARGLHVGVAKPVETGCRATARGLEAADARALAVAAGSSEPADAVCPYRLPDPLAPLLAAERAGTVIDVAMLVRELRIRAREVDVLLIEGAGGFLVHLDAQTTWRDLARRLAAPVLVVVGSRLGAINHALLTFEAVDRGELASPGYVLSRLAAEGDLAADTNPVLLQRLATLPCVGALPWLPDADVTITALGRGGAPADTACERLVALAEECLDLDAIARSSVAVP